MDFDILVIGAGPAGLSFARAMAETGLQIALIEKQPRAAIENPAYDGREIALTHFSQKIMRELGMWDLLPEDKISRIKTAKVLNGASSYALSFDYSETKEDTLGFMLSNQMIRKAAYDSVQPYQNVHILDEQEVTAITTDAEHACLSLKNGDTLTAALAIAADSRFSTTRRLMGISTSMLDFGRSCVVCVMEATEPHNATALECFHYGRTLAVLPLPDNKVSVVITLPSEQNAALMALSPENFARDIEDRLNGALGTMTLVTERYPYPLVATLAKKFATNRYALIGDAAVGMHPVTAHGFNLGLRGAHTLAQALKKSLPSLPAPKALEQYNLKHRRTAVPLYHGTNALVKLYTDETALAKVARSTLLRLGNHIKPAKRLILNQLTESHAA